MTSAPRKENLGEEGGEEHEIFANQCFFFKKSLKVSGKCSVMNVSRIQRPINLALSIEEKHRAKHVRVQNPE